MPDTIRQQICAAIQTRLAAILVAGGYATNLGQNVTPWRDLDAAPFGEAEAAGIAWRDPKCETQQLTFAKHEHRLHIEADLLLRDAATTPTTARKAIADVWKAVGVDRKWGGLALDTDPVSDELDIIQDRKIIAGSRVRFIVKFRTANFDPYTA